MFLRVFVLIRDRLLTRVTIYLACTVRGDRGGVVAGRAICDRLRQHGHEVLTAHLLEDNVETAESELTEDAVFRRDLEWLSRCDVLVAEASGSSFGVGFEVGYVLARADRTRQRVVLLYDRARVSSISRLVVGNVHPACATFGYASVDELLAFIDQRFRAA